MCKRWTLLAGALLGCASTVQDASEEDVSTATLDATMGVDVAADRTTAPDVRDAGRDSARAEVADDAPRCDPTVLADSGVDDAGTPSDAVHVVELAVAAQLHECARMSDGTVRCRGINRSGQLGLGTMGASVWEPTPVPDLTGVAQVVTSNVGVTCTRHDDGTVRCWGSNQWRTLGTGPAGDERCGPAGESACRTRPTLVPGLTDVVHLAVGLFAICAVRRDGSVWCWGESGLPRFQRGSAFPVRIDGLSDVTGMWYRQLTWIARLRDGRYLPTMSSLTPIEIPAEAELADGPYGSHYCYRLPDTSVRCLGANAEGQVGNGTSAYREKVVEPFNPGLCGVRSVVTGPYHTCALLADRTVRCWGSAEYGGVGVAGTQRCVGTTMMSVECVPRPTPVPGIDRVTQLFLGVWGTCALRDDHSVWCWGSLSPDRSTAMPQRVVW